MFIGKDMTSLKRLFAMGVLICVAMTAFCIPAAPVAAEENTSPDVVSAAGAADIPQYAEIYVDETGVIKTVNIDKYENGSYNIVEEDGEYGIYFTNSINLAINDDFLYENPEGEEIYIDVTYYDGGRTNLFLHYDGYGTALNSKMGFVGEPNTVYNTVDYLNILGDDPMWRTKRFILTDFAAMNRNAGKYDMRLSTWDLLGTGIASYRPVVKSLKIYRKPWNTPLRVTDWGSFVGSERAGNMLSDSETPVLNIPLANASADSSIKTKITVNIRNSNDMLLSTHQGEFELAAGEEKTVTMEVTNPKRYGVYWAEIITETATDGGEYVADEKWKQVDFSVSHLWDPETLNERQGVNEHTLTPADVNGEMMMRSGIGWVRQGQVRSWAKLDENGRFVDVQFVDIFPEYYNRGIDIQMEARTPFYTIESRLNGTYELAFGNLARPNLPLNQEEFDYFVKYITDMAYQYRDMIDDVEIFNEPEGNANDYGGGEGGERLAEVVEAMYASLKATTPELTVSGPTFMSYSEHLLDPFMEAGGLDNLDIYTMHMYDWSGAWDVQLYGHDTAQQHIDLMKSKGYENFRMWLTEVGFTSQDMRKEGHQTGMPAKASVFPEGATRRTQARNTVLANASFYAFNQFEKWFWHCWPDRYDATENEHCFGFINDRDGGQGYTPLTAKPNLIALSGANHFLKTNTQEKGIIGNSTDRIWAFHYYTPEIEKDVMVISAEQLYSGQRAYNLGCETVDVYDMFANYVGTMKSDDGIFTFSIFSEPYYVVGNFTKFEEAQKTPEIEPVSVQATGVNGDIAPFELKKNTGKNYTIKVDDLAVVSNEGFVGDSARVLVQAPSWDYGTAYATISVFDEEGYLCYVSPGEVAIKDPVTVSFERFKFSEYNDVQWGVMAKVTNNAQNKELNGQLYVEKPASIANLNETREFTNLKAGTSVTYIFNLPEMVNKQFIDMRAILTLDTGFRAIADETLDFTTAKYAYTKPTIDGINTPGEWNSTWFGANSAENVYYDPNYPGTWTGPNDLSITAQAMWDEEYMYLLCITTDDVHTATAERASLNNYVNIWNMDGIQLAMHDEEDINVILTGKFAEIGWALEDNFGQVSWCWNMHYDASKISMPLQEAEHFVKRYDTYTIYEIKVPWSELFYDGYVVDPSKNMRMAILMNDMDGNDPRYGMEYGGGIGSAQKDATQFSRMTLVY